jgi:hypothetical protein
MSSGHHPGRGRGGSLRAASGMGSGPFSGLSFGFSTGWGTAWGTGWVAAWVAAWASPVRAWQSRIAFVPEGSSSP